MGAVLLRMKGPTTLVVGGEFPLSLKTKFKDTALFVAASFLDSSFVAPRTLRMALIWDAEVHQATDLCRTYAWLTENKIHARAVGDQALLLALLDSYRTIRPMIVTRAVDNLDQSDTTQRP